MLRLGLQSDLRGMVLELVELLIRKTVALLLRKRDAVHLGRYTFFRFLWQCSGLSIDDVDKGFVMIVLEEVGWIGFLEAEADSCDLMRLVRGPIFCLLSPVTQSPILVYRDDDEFSSPALDVRVQA